MADHCSAHVVLTLFVGGLELALSHLNPRDLIVRDPCAPLAAQNARLRVAVDDDVQETEVYLPHGVPGAAVPVAYW